jgi:heavy metal sensor kinase
LPLTLFLMGCCGIFFLRIVLRPVQNISDTARDIEAKDLSRRIMVTTQDELGTLAATINHMIARLEKAFLRQKELTGDASHELRAPLTVIQAEATLALQRKREASSYQKSLEIIAKESDHMAAIIGQLLFLARADSGNEMADLTEMDLGPFIQELSRDIEPLFHEKQQTLMFHQTGPVVVKADCSLLRTAMLNLLRNAMQYTPERGEISLSLQKQNSMARISVSDNGIGIPEDALPYIFNRFYRVDKARARESGSSGLGLAICKHIVELHQGQISVRSQVDKGTIFLVKLPLA